MKIISIEKINEKEDNRWATIYFRNAYRNL